MNITDIIALAKQGYKPSDIKELLEMAVPVKDQTEEAEQKTVPEEVQKVEAKADDSEDAIDYKQLYEEEKTKTDQLSDQLSKAQSTNVTKELPQDNTSNDDILGDLMRSFM